MKRNFSLLRDILLQIEEKDVGDMNWVSLDFPELESAILVEHLYMLHEANFIEGNGLNTLGGRTFKPKRLTVYGHDFLDSIREKDIWDQTRDAAEKIGGGTFDLVAQIAQGFIKTKLKKHTGIEF